MDGVHVRVRIGAEHYAMAVQHVREVVDVGELTPVPGAPAAVLGLRNLAGEIVPAVDLARAVGAGRGSEVTRLVVVEHEGRPTALAVDEVVDVGTLAADADEHESPHLSCSVVLDGTLVGVLALETVLGSVA